MERSAARASRRSGPRIVRTRPGRRARLAAAARRRGRPEAPADQGPRLGAADLRALRIRNARRRQRLQRAERPAAVAGFQRRARLRSRGRQAGAAVEHRLDRPADRARNLPGGGRADRRRRCPLLPRGEELHYRRRFPAAGETAGAALANGRCLSGPGISRAGRSGQARGVPGIPAFRGDCAADLGNLRPAGQDRDQARPGGEGRARA